MMQQKNHFWVDGFRFAVALATTIFSLVLSICLITMGRYGSALAFFIIFLLFLPILKSYGATVTVDEEGIRSSFLGKTRLSMRWDEIGEIGVAGSRLFNNKNGEKPGFLYIYVSPSSMTDEERFQMMLKFPPKDKIFFSYSKESIFAVQMRWSSKIQTYNSGNVRFD